MSKGQQQTIGARIAPDVGGKPGLAPSTVVAVPPGLTPAWFTDRELVELRKVCRDYDGELAERFLKTALARADRSP